jgi:hypothetical protein
VNKKKQCSVCAETQKFRVADLQKERFTAETQRHGEASEEKVPSPFFSVPLCLCGESSSSNTITMLRR